MTAPNAGTPEPGPDASVSDIHADIEATRQELGQTVEALTAKLDVKQQAKQKVDDTKELITARAQTARAKGVEVGTQVLDAATDDQGTVRPAIPAAAVALVVVVGLLIWRRRR